MINKTQLLFFIFLFVIDGNGLIASHSVLTNNDNCKRSKQITVQDKEGILIYFISEADGSCEHLDFVAEVEHASCGETGAIWVTVKNGNPKYTVEWWGANISKWINTDVEKFQLIDLVAGEYTVKITDANGCTATKTINIEDNASNLELALESTAASCGNEGSCWVTINNGLPIFIVELWGPNNVTFWTEMNSVSFKLSELIAGYYTLKITDSNGCTITENFEIGIGNSNISMALVANNGSCDTNGDVLVTIQNGDEPYNVSWDGPINENFQTTNSTFQINNLPKGIYEITVKDNNGCSTVQTIEILVDREFTFTTQHSDARCNQNGKLWLDMEGGTAPFSINLIGPLIDNVSTDDFNYYFPSISSGTYTLTIRDSKGCEQSKEIVINKHNEIGTRCDDGNPNTQDDTIQEDCECKGIIPCIPPVADAGDNKILTCTTSTIEIGGKNSSDGVGFIYEWTSIESRIDSGASTPFATISQAGTYFLKISTEVGGCSTTDSVIVTEDKILPEVSIRPPTPLNCEVEEIVIEAEGSREWNYKWTTENGQILAEANTLQLLVGEPGNYFLTTENPNNGCSTIQETIVILDTIAPKAIITGKDTLTCINNELMLDASTSERAASYYWTNGDNSINHSEDSIKVNSADTYKVIVIGTNGCMDSVSTTIIADKKLPEITIDIPDTLNCKQPILQLNAIAQVNMAQYNWQTLDGRLISESNTANPIIDQPGNYEIIATGLNGCTNTAMVQVVDNFEPPIADAGNDNQTLPCDMSNLVLDASASKKAINYYWKSENGIFANTNVAQAKVEVLSSGLYQLMVTGQNGCQDSTFVVVNESVLSAKIEAVKEISCSNQKDGSFSIKALGGVGPYSYSLDGTNFQPQNVFNDLGEGDYIPMIKDADDCSIEVDTLITLKSPPQITIDSIIQENDIGICAASASPIKVTAHGGTGDLQFSWTGPNISKEGEEIIVAPETTDYYIVEAIDEHSCKSRDSILVEVLQYGEKPFIIVPSSMEENTLKISCLEDKDNVEEQYPEREIYIYNRWGGIVYHAKPYNNDWDGRNQNGEMLPYGTYYYLLRLNVGGSEILKGDILLLR